MKQISMSRRKAPFVMPCARDIIPIILLFLAARSEVLGMHPFALAFFGGVVNKKYGYIGIVSALLGVVTRSGVVELPSQFLSFLVYWLASNLYKTKNTTIGSLMVGGSVALSGGMLLFLGYDGLFDIFLLFTESITAMLMYILFLKANTAVSDFSHRRGMNSEDYIAIAVMVGVILSGLGGIGYKSVSLTHILTTYILLTAALNTNVCVSATTGVAVGFMASMTGEGAVVMMGVYGFSALFASFMNTFRRAGAFLGYITAMSVMMMYCHSLYEIPSGILNAVIGGGLFLVTPKVCHEYMRSFFTKSLEVESVSPESRVKEFLAMRLRATAETFSSLYDCFFSVSEGRLKKYSDDLGMILDQTCERVCTGCKMCGKCWQTDFRRSYKNSLELIGVIESEGELTEDNLPKSFANRCERPRQFIDEINHVYELYKRDILRRGDAITNRNLISQQYSELGRLFEAMATDVSEGFEFMEREEEDIVDALDKEGIVPYEISVIESASGVCEVYLRLAPMVAYPQIAGILTKVLGRTMTYDKTENGLSKFTSGAMYTVVTSRLQLERDRSGANGDSINMFTVDNSKFYCILADGMGSGMEARYESMAACKLLGGFLKSGIGAKTALGILNSAMCLNMEREMYSTIDLLCVDLYTAEVTMYKIGSAQTLIRKGNEIKSITSSSVPIGIVSDVRLDKKTVELSEGDTIVMMSDGITESGSSLSHTEWIKKIMMKPQEDVETLSKEIMDTALRKDGGFARDDMSVVTIRIMAK